MSKARRQKEKGVALVTTMIVVAVLAVVAVAFMQSASTDRLSSRTGKNYMQARLAAEAGASAAEALVADLIKRYPDSATVWQNIGSGAAAGTNNEATVLYVRAQSANTNLGARPGQFGSEVSLLAQPLVSGSSLTALGSLSGSMVFAANNASMVNLNATNSSQPRPFVGLRSATNAGAPVTAARWLYLGAQPGPTNAANPAIARYAFWVEDESFKVNVNVATSGQRGVDSLGLSPTESRLDGSWGSSSNAALRGVNAGSVVSARNGLPGSNFPTAVTAAIPANLTDATAADELRFLTTASSAGLDLSRGGFKRFNISTVTNGVTGPADANNIRTSLNRVIAAMTNSNSVPNFGQRFYRLNANAAGVNASNAVTANHAAIYLNKIAANILDYVDGDDQPTIVNVPTNTTVFTNMSDFSIRVGKPEFGIEPQGGGTEGSNSVAAMGVENTPRLQEYAIHGRLRKMEPFGYSTNAAPPDPSAEYEISIDHYFEFWNPGTRDITINNAFLKIYDQPKFGNNITGALGNEGRPTSEIPVNGVVFPAGQVTVLTTAPQDEINSLLVGANSGRVVSLPAPEADRLFKGLTRDVSTNSYAGFNRLFNVSMNARTVPGQNDYESAVILYNGSGLLESFVGLPIARQSGFVPALHFVVDVAEKAGAIGDLSQGNSLWTRGGSLVGNEPVTTASTPFSTEGDPRSLNEQLEIKLYDSGSIFTAREQTRFFLTMSNDNNVPGSSTLGGPNTVNNYVRPANWVDFSSVSASANNAPLLVRNGSLQSIGELGHLTDPARVPGTSGTLTNVIYSRGGGRTLRIGQSEHPRWYDASQTNASRTWTSWRLTDVFTTKTNISIPGLINPNGFLRDRGAAFRAAVHGLNYLPAPEGVGLPALNDFRLNGILNAVATRMTNAAVAGLPTGSVNAFWERGEISELPVFNTGSIPATMSNQFDRGREELVRRSIEMITTRGSIFTVYAIGQTLQGTNVTGTARMKQTFQIEPQFATGDAFNDNFTVNPTRIARRFAAPTNYTTRVLATFYD